MDEDEFNKHNDLDQLEMDNREMARIIEELQQQNEELHQQADEGLDARQQVEELQAELERLKTPKTPNQSSEEKKEDDDVESDVKLEVEDILSPLPEKPHQVWKQLNRRKANSRRTAVDC